MLFDPLGKPFNIDIEKINKVLSFSKKVIQQKNEGTFENAEQLKLAMSAAGEMLSLSAYLLTPPSSKEITDEELEEKIKEFKNILVRMDQKEIWIFLNNIAFFLNPSYEPNGETFSTN